jgi:Carboxypeptidase regulatory-like domain
MKVLALLFLVVGIPGAALGQGTIAGAVRDQSGAPLSGVTITAASPALIEKVRASVTDDAGQYRIENLRPGIYSVSFSRDQFSARLSEGIELTGSFTATVNAELVAGPLTEIVTVTGGSPVVDAHTAKHEVTLESDTLKAIPTVRSYNALLVLVPGVITTTNDVVTGTAATQFPIHGGRAAEGRLSVDGLTVGSPPNGSSPTNYSVDVGSAQEVTFSTSGALGEAETAGVVMNIVPRTGGNIMSGSVFAGGTGAGLQSDNLTPALTAQGLTAATPLSKAYDISGTLGGPIWKDRAWYFVSGHTGGSTRDSATVFYNLNAADAAQWLYAPDVNRRAYSDRTFEDGSARVTWQATPRDKVGAFLDKQIVCRTCTGATPGLSEPQRSSPEAVGVLGRPLQVTQATWSSPVTSRLLIEAGFGGTSFGVGNFERSPNPTRDLIRVVEQCASGCAANGNIQGLAYRSQDFSSAYTRSHLWKGSVSYVTGTHSVKAGYQHTMMTDDRLWMTNDQNLTYRVDNGVPNQLTESISPWTINARVAWDAVFIQDQWTVGRFTLQGAARFDRAYSWFPAQQEGPSRFLPAPIVIPETRGVDSYKDISPRMGAAYDLFGTGRTALKLNVGRYLDGAGATGNYANTNPSMRMPQTTSVFGTPGVTRPWIDANVDFQPDCDLSNPNAQDLRASGGDLCGVVSNTSFGKNVLTNNFAPDALNGWGVRPSDWDLGASIQQQLFSRASVELAFTRRSYHGFFVADNVALQPSDFTPFSLVAPSDPRLPGGGGYTISGLYDVVPEKAGQVSNLITNSDKYGAWKQYFNGIDLGVNVRALNGLTVFGGTSTGQTVADNCDVRAHLPELATTTTGTSAFGAGLMGSAVTTLSPYCHVAYGFLTQLRGLASYVIPRADIQVSTTFQSKPGPLLSADYVVPNANVAPALNRNLSGNAPSITVNLVAPGTMYGNRINELDLRGAKILKYGRTRTTVAVDVYNALNSSAVLAYNTSFVPGGTWLQPITVMTPRSIRLTAEIGF